MEKRTLIDRETERRDLHELLKSGGPHLGLLTGRRRVGKTFLLTNVWDDQPFFLFTAAQTTPEINRRQLISDLAAWSGEELYPEDYPTWRSIFALLFNLGQPDPLVIILDEFQYLATDAEGVSAVASELNAVWERSHPSRPFLLLLAGSAVGTMESLAVGGGPLYGRFSWQCRLRPFDYWHAAAMAPFQQSRDRALAYGIFGGTPRYLAAIDPVDTLEENVIRLLLKPTGEVRLLVETALDQEEGLRDHLKYRAILRAVADGCTERNDIAGRTGLSNDAALRDKLSRLMELGYIETYRNIDARPNEPVRYGIADPAFRFHKRFIEPSASMLERYPAERIWKESVAPRLDGYMGHEFERIAAQAYDRLAQQSGLPLVEKWSRWEGTDRNRESLEIDIVAPLIDGRVMTGAIKWNRSPIGIGLHHSHVDMLRRAAAAGRKWAFRGLEPEAPLLYIAAGGFTDAFVREAKNVRENVILWSLDDLYRA